jgi:hypothetical protein
MLDLDDGRRVAITHDDVRLLVEELWGIAAASARPGPVVTAATLGELLRDPFAHARHLDGASARAIEDALRSLDAREPLTAGLLVLAQAVAARAD